MSANITYADFKSVQFHLSYSRSTHFKLLNTSTYETPRFGKRLSSFCLILKGSAVFSTEDGCVRASEGDFIYMPDGIQYRSEWSGSPEIEFLSTFFRFSGMHTEKYSKTLDLINFPLDQQLAFQVIKPVGNYAMLEPMTALLNCDRSEPAQQLIALSLLYQIFAQIYPYLRTREKKKTFDALTPAINHINANFTCNEPVSVYADLCHLSESRFHHVFRQYMNQTPIEYRNTLRMRNAARLLSETSESIEWVSTQLGYESPIYFRREFKRYFECTPREYRKKSQMT